MIFFPIAPHIQGTLEVTEEKKFIKEKLATLLAACAERSWPSRWPSFNRTMLDLYAGQVSGVFA